MEGSSFSLWTFGVMTKELVSLGFLSVLIHQWDSEGKLFFLLPHTGNLLKVRPCLPPLPRIDWVSFLRRDSLRSEDISFFKPGAPSRSETFFSEMGMLEGRRFSSSLEGSLPEDRIYLLSLGLSEDSGYFPLQTRDFLRLGPISIDWVPLRKGAVFLIQV